MGLIFVLIDGVGLAPPSANNPVPRSCVRLAARLGVPLTDSLHVATDDVHARPIDATLGIEGRPQSGSGHSAIFGGYNAAAANGRHQPSYPTIAMREHLAGRNMLLAAKQTGARVAWANAYLPGYTAAVEGKRLRHTAGTWSALQAGVRLRGVDDLEAGSAVSWDITQELARTRPGCGALPVIEPAEAGLRLLCLAHRYDLVAWETYLPDLAGHQRIPYTPERALALVDGLLDAVVGGLGSDDALVVTSDHGNVEDATTRVHTRNPVPLLAWGRAAQFCGAARSIADVMDVVLQGIP
jgi:2,3-bisphosphoglycerate-independent phosphoglycerate mutase